MADRDHAPLGHLSTYDSRSEDHVMGQNLADGPTSAGARSGAAPVRPARSLEEAIGQLMMSGMMAAGRSPSRNERDGEAFPAGAGAIEGDASSTVHDLPHPGDGDLGEVVEGIFHKALDVAATGRSVSPAAPAAVQQEPSPALTGTLAPMSAEPEVGGGDTESAHELPAYSPERPEVAHAMTMALLGLW